MISQAEFGNASNNPVTINKSAVAENTKFDGPASIKTPSIQNKFAANSNKPLPKPGFSD